MSDNNLKKIIVFSSVDVKKACMELIKRESAERNTSESVVIEEYILRGVISNFPEETDFLREVYRKRFKYADEKILKEKTDE